MHDLLKIEDEVVSGSFTPYDDFDYWEGDPCTIPIDEDETVYLCTEAPTYPEDSTVDLIFIDDEITKKFREDCIMEFNPYELEENIIRDSSGWGHKAILLGDYAVAKPDYGIDASRGEEADTPELDDERGPF